MSSGSSNSQLLNMPDYGEGLSESLKAQISVLDGSLPGSEGNTLQNIMERYERPLRMSAAQIDNDVLRQTLLGSQTPVFKSASPENTIRRASPGSTQATQIDYGGTVMDDGRVIVGDGEIPEWQKALSEIGSFSYKSSGLSQGEYNDKLRAMLSDWEDKHGDSYESVDKALMTGAYDDRNKAEHYPTSNNPDASILAQSLHLEMLFYGKSDLINNIYDVNPPEPIYKKKEDGTDFIVPKDENGEFILETTNAEEIPSGGVAAPAGELTGYTRAGTGLVDMLGDSRNALGQVADYGRYIKTNPELHQKFLSSQQAGDTRTIEEFGRDYYNQYGQSEGRELPTKFGELDRQSGFDEEGNFLGLAALAEDIQQGNLSRQREADLLDVERLAGRYEDVMDPFRFGVRGALSNAGAVLKAQKENLTGAGALTVPGDTTYGGDIEAGTMTAAQIGETPSLTAGTSYTAAQVADPMALTAATSYDPSASVTGDGYTATANLEGGNIGADSLRAALLADAETALGQGLTDREQASISNAARARQTMMGRTFDQSGAIAEAQALVAENNNRRMQNRAFAGDTLGRESDIQRSDLDRGLQANIRNQDALNRAAEFGASQNMQAQLANQAATNQALSQGLTAGLSQEALAAQQQQAKAMADATAANRASEFGVGAGMEQDALRAQLGQQTNLAQAQMDQQANAFGADAAQRAAAANQAQTQQANQFGVGATMDAQRLNEQLKQSGTLGYIDASARLAALEDQYSLDPFQAILGRAGGGSLQAGQGVFGQAGYGLSSGPQYLNPESGLGFISQMAANNANMYAANQAADASRTAGMMNMFGSLGGGIAGGLIGLAG